MKSSTLGFLLMICVAVPAVGSAQAQQRPSAAGRYTITSSAEGLYFLDTATGALWLKPLGRDWQRVDSPVNDSPVSEPHPEEAGESDGFEIPEGFRLVTVNIAGVPAHIDAIRQRDLVDVFVTYQVQDPMAVEPMKTKLILERIEVFAIGKDPDNPDDKARNISLLVTPKQQVILGLAEKKGDIGVVLRPKHNTATDP